MLPEWEKTAKALEGIVEVGEVDISTDDLSEKYDLKEFPSLKFFGNDK